MRRRRWPAPAICLRPTYLKKTVSDFTESPDSEHCSSPAEIAALSTDLLAAVRTGDPTDEYVAAVAGLDESALDRLGDDPDAAKAFWINCYNAAAQIGFRELAAPLENKRSFFGDRRFVVAGTPRSLDDIEHGILRASMSKYGLGYLPSLFRTAFERRHRLKTVDCRIHFALNCAAASCPPIRSYHADRIDAELDLATASYLDAEAAYDPDAGTVEVPRLLFWYRGDFGGRGGIYDLLQRHGVVPKGERPSVSYRAYDWTPAAAKFDDPAGD